MNKTTKYLIIIIPILLLLFSCTKQKISPEQAKSFVKFFDEAFSNISNIKGEVKQTSDGGYAVITTVKSENDDADICFIRTDKNGNLLWSPKYFGSKLDDFGTALEITDNGYVLLCTITDTTSDGTTHKEIYLLEISNNGDSILWEKKYGGSGDEEGYDIEQTSSGGFIFAGYTSTDTLINSNDEGINKDIWVVNTDAQGEINWKRATGFESDDYATGIIEKDDGGYLVIGTTNRDGNTDIGIYQLTESGIFATGKFFGSTGNDLSGNIVKTSDSYLLAGSIYNAQNNIQNMFLVKSNDNVFNPEFENNYSSGYNTTNIIVRYKTNDQIAVMGTTTIINNEDINIRITDNTGENVGEPITIGSESDQHGIAFDVTADGGFIILGINTVDELNIITLIKTKPDGSL